MSSLPPIEGHEEARAAIARAVRDRALPGSLLFHGPTGVGRQRLGLWVAQLLLCEAPADLEPCGTCTSCRMVLSLAHPDLHWFFPLPRPRVSGGPERLADALEEARGQELAARRLEPLRISSPGEPVGLYLAQMQTLRKLASVRPALGERSVFLVADAELLVPQESSPEAANALLKLLEEPPPSATIILTAIDPDALLPTLRSRLLPVRLRPLPRERVADYLVRQRGVDRSAAARAAALADGAIGRALGFLPVAGQPGALESIRQHGRSLLEAALAREPALRWRVAHSQPPAGARGSFQQVLESLALWLRDLAAVAAGSEDSVVNSDALDLLRAFARRIPDDALRIPEALEAVEQARYMGRTNINPQLTLAWLLQRINGALIPRREAEVA